MKYEYKIVELDQGLAAKCTEWRLNELGAEGWELMFAVYDRSKPSWPAIYYHFKRAIV